MGRVRNMDEKELLKLQSVNNLHMALFCSNTLMTKERYKLFYKNLIVYEDYLEIYEQDFNYFVNYIIYKIIKNSLHTTKSILTYESYFYKVISNYCLKHNLEDATSTIVKYWLLIINISSKILDMLNNNSIKNIYFNNKYYLPFPHQDSNVSYFSYYVEALITVEFIDNTINIINILPENNNKLLNLNNLSFVKYFNKNLKNIYNFYLSSTTPSYEFSSLQLSQFNINLLVSLYKSQNVSFNKANISNCNLCPLHNICKNSYKLYNTIPIVNKPINREASVKLLNKK